MEISVMIISDKPADIKELKSGKDEQMKEDLLEYGIR
jgi:hypothetical protein